ncbi:MAG: hypothetical protein V2J65_22500 [Desulfobacteraceae bacterium]|jgi:REP element-mobilizing transposase RayT|nr:hypothetical protein [Desulfobacteraceae bacterium]
MPRPARVGAPSAARHIIVRRIERRRILCDDLDRDDLVNRLGGLVLETGPPCLAWALIPHHFHLLLQTGPVPVAPFKRCLLSGCAIRFTCNEKHRKAQRLRPGLSALRGGFAASTV